MKKVKKVKPVLQMEVSECGAASLAMILSYYKRNIPLEQLRKECGVSRNGVNAKSIVNVAKHHGLIPTAFRADMDNIHEINTPAIIHWNMDHFLVLCGFNKKGAVLADPASGIREVSLDEFSKSFTGIVLEFTPSENFTQDSAVKAKSYITECTSKTLHYLAVFVLIELCAVVASVCMTFIDTIFIDKVLLSNDVKNLDILLRITIVTGLISCGAMLLHESTKIKCTKKLNALINSGFMNRILSLPSEFFAQRNSADLSSRQNANMLLGENIWNFLSMFPSLLLQITVYLTLVLFLDYKFAILGIALTLLNALIFIQSYKLYNKSAMLYSRDESMLYSDITRTIDAIETIKSTGSEDAVFIRLLSKGTQLINSNVMTLGMGARISECITYMNKISSAVILIVGVWEIISGAMSSGILIAMQSLVLSMIEPTGSLINSAAEFHETKNQSIRTDDVMNYNEDTSFLHAQSIQTAYIDGKITLKNITFSYNPLEKPFIDGLNLEIKKGECIALTGKSGSGKSTISSIISGLLMEESGEVCFDGFPRSAFNKYYFYSVVASVSQNIRLFEGSILDNITMWDNDISYDEAVEAAKLACIHDDIIQRHNGYREKLSENGKNLSGGQRQRIQLARALVRKPKILILDEATSALDADTEAQVMKNVRSMGITVITVAHRLSTIRDADRILVISSGHISESGTHDELMSLGGEYCDLVRSME